MKRNELIELLSNLKTGSNTDPEVVLFDSYTGVTFEPTDVSYDPTSGEIEITVG